MGRQQTGRKNGRRRPRRIVTISREFGSGGRELGKRLADLLGYDYYDSEIIARVAEKSGMTPVVGYHFGAQNHDELKGLLKKSLIMIGTFGVTSALISFLRTLVFQVAAVLLLPRAWGIDGVWYSIVVAEGMAVILSAVFLLLKRKKYQYF